MTQVSELSGTELAEVSGHRLGGCVVPIVGCGHQRFAPYPGKKVATAYYGNDTSHAKQVKNKIKNTERSENKKIKILVTCKILIFSIFERLITLMMHLDRINDQERVAAILFSRDSESPMRTGKMTGSGKKKRSLR